MRVAGPLLLCVAATSALSLRPVAIRPLPLARAPPAHLARPRAAASSVRMGVAGLGAWLSSAVPDAIQPLPPNFTASVVAFDLNSILHAQLRRATNEEHALTLVFARLHMAFKLVKPGSVVLLALDGPAPLAKLSTQRVRRLKTTLKGEQPRGITSLVATPGTSFMLQLEQALVFFICSELSTYRARGITFRLSGADMPGEGEIKLLGALHQLDAEARERGGPQGAGRGPGRRRSAVLVGGDGDLVLQALTLRSWDVAVLRELPAKGQCAEVVSLNRMRSGLGFHTPVSSSRPPRELDLIVLACLMGNDYLPKVREASFERLWRSYGALRALPEFEDASLLDPTRRTFNVPFLRTLLTVLVSVYRLQCSRLGKLVAEGTPYQEAKAEAATFGFGDEMMRKLALSAVNATSGAAQPDGGAEQASGQDGGQDGGPRGGPPRKEDNTTSTPWYGGAEKNALKSASWVNTKPALLRSERHDTRLYLEGVLWTVQMYVDGVCPDYSWEHEGEVAPTSHQMIYFLIGLGTDGDAAAGADSAAGASAQDDGRRGRPCRVPNSGNPPLPAPVACSVVMPHDAAAELVPPMLHESMQEGGPLHFVRAWEKPHAREWAGNRYGSKKAADATAAEAAAEAAAAEAEAEAAAETGAEAVDEDDDEDEDEDDEDDDEDEDEDEDDDDEEGDLVEDDEQDEEEGASKAPRRRKGPRFSKIDYSALLAAADRMDSRLMDRARSLSARPAWLELKRETKFASRTERARHSGPMPPLPIVPPPPPTERMAPIKPLRTDRLTCEWVECLSKPPLYPWVGGDNAFATPAAGGRLVGSGAVQGRGRARGAGMRGGGRGRGRGRGRGGGGRGRGGDGGGVRK